MEEVPQHQSFVNERTAEIFDPTKVEQWLTNFTSRIESIEAKLEAIELTDQPKPTQRHEASAITIMGQRDENKRSWSNPKWSNPKESNRAIHPAAEDIDDAEDTGTDIDNSRSGDSDDRVEENSTTALSENSRSAFQVLELWDEQLIKGIRPLLAPLGYSSTANVLKPVRIILSVQSLAKLDQNLEVTLHIRGPSMNSAKTSK